MRHSDNLNGTFTNPVVFADYPDTDIIRVGSDFYMVSSSFHHAPGIPVCHSRDLVNWRVIGHAYERLPEANPAYSLKDGKVAYKGGSWAPCIRHHNGKFYIGFNTPDEGFFMCIAARPEGPYERVPFHRELYDPGLFFDDDGRVYVFHAAIGICVTELAADARSVKSGPVPIYQTAFGYPFEGSHPYKRNGWYYVCVTARGYNGLQLCLRSRQIHGPYEARVLSGDDMNYAGAGLHQGGFVELEHGETWFFLFQDRDFIGRVPVLQPVHWTDDWPVFGDPSNFWKAAVTCRKPSVGGTYPVAVPIEGDEFESPKLGLQWEWSHNPDDTRWSLTERPGWLRLTAGPAADFLNARNTLTQRITGPSSTAVTRLDVSGLGEGDIAGLAIANMPYAFIAVRKELEQKIRVMMVDNGRVVAESAPTTGSEIYLKANADVDGFARFFYSTDGETFTPLGEPFLMEFTVKTFLGNRFGLFCYHAGDGAKTGFADFDFLRREALRPANRYQASEWIPAVAYDDERGTDTHRPVAKQPGQFLVAIDDGDSLQFDQVDFAKGATRFVVRASAVFGGVIELRLDAPDGPLIGRCAVPDNGNRNAWGGDFAEYVCDIEPVQGLHALHLLFRGDGLNLFRLDAFSFKR
jgi:xylan 1,4-beta-xylosidase